MASSLSTAIAFKADFGGHASPARQANLHLLNSRSEFSGARAGKANLPRDQAANGSLKVDSPTPRVAISPANGVKRRSASWPGMTVEIVQATSSERTEYRFRAPMHLLVLCDRGVRREGETYVEGLPRSGLRDVTRKLTFVPAGHDYCDWHEPRTPARMAFFYFEPAALPVGPDEVPLAPRLLFEDTPLFDTAHKLTALIDGVEIDNSSYCEALGRVLAHELVRLQQGSVQTKQTVRGGLAAWQQRSVTSYIEEHLAEHIPLSTLAELANLSTYHFCRAFKQSFGIPPHRYHTSMRIERAKALLARPAMSVTDIGLTVGFSETSSFTAAFRKATGLTPTGYHRSLA